MLAVPWYVYDSNIDQNDIQPSYGEIAEELCSCIFDELKQLKNDVGTYKIENGEESWKIVVERTDTRVQMPLTLEKPINRAYFKMVEIIRTCIIAPSSTSFHMCEAPGGFVQACQEEFGKHLKSIHCTSLMSTNNPNFHSYIGQENINIMKHGNNDITCPNIRQDHINELGPHSCELITADGAIDNDVNPENIEQNTALLIASEIVLAMELQKDGGTFVLKIFGMQTKITLELIAILSSVYEHVNIVKPFTSRAVNDERYVVCQQFCKNKKITINLEQKPLCRICKHIDETWFEEIIKISKHFCEVQSSFLKKALMHKNIGKGRGKGRGRGRGRGRGKGIGKGNGKGEYSKFFQHTDSNANRSNTSNTNTSNTGDKST